MSCFVLDFFEQIGLIMGIIHYGNLIWCDQVFLSCEKDSTLQS